MLKQLVHVEKLRPKNQWVDPPDLAGIDDDGMPLEDDLRRESGDDEEAADVPEVDDEVEREPLVEIDDEETLPVRPRPRRDRGAEAERRRVAEDRQQAREAFKQMVEGSLVRPVPLSEPEGDGEEESSSVSDEPSMTSQTKRLLARQKKQRVSSLRHRSKPKRDA